jgi:hypothetical protein
MPKPFEELGAKGAGAVRAVTGAVRGLHGVFNTLARQHAEVSVLLERARTAVDEEKRVALWKKIRTELLSHERGELAVVYPALAANGRLQGIVDEHQQQAEELESAIAAIDDSSLASDAFPSQIEALISLVKQHVDEEENHWFPEAAEVLSKGEVEELDQRYVAKREALIEQM